MTLPSSTTIQNLSREHVVPGMLPTGLVDQFIRKVPFQRLEKPGELVEWNRASAAPSVSPYAAGGALAATATDSTKVTATLRRIGDVAEVDYFTDTAAGDPMNQLEVQVDMKKAGIVRRLGIQAIQGDGTGNNIEGMTARLTAGQTKTVTLGLNKEDLHKLVSMVTASDGYVGAGPDCLVATERVVREVIKVMEDAAGGLLTYAFDADLGVPVPHFHGIPVYVGQDITTTNQIWAVKLRGPTGTRLLHSGGKPSEFGIEVVPVPMQATVSKRGAFVGGYYTLLVPEEQSIAQLKGFTLSVPA